MSAEDIVAVNQLDRKALFAETENVLKRLWTLTEHIQDEKKAEEARLQINAAYNNLKQGETFQLGIERVLLETDHFRKSAEQLADRMVKQRDIALHDLVEFLDALKSRNTSHPMVSEVIDELESEFKSRIAETMPEYFRESLPDWGWDDSETLYLALTYELTSIDAHFQRECGFGQAQLKNFRDDLKKMVRKLSEGQYRDDS